MYLKFLGNMWGLRQLANWLIKNSINSWDITILYCFRVYPQRMKYLYLNMKNLYLKLYYGMLELRTAFKRALAKGFNIWLAINKRWRLIIKYLNIVEINNSVNLMMLKDRHYGKRCFIIGNGQSLAKTDLSLIKNEITFGVNKIFRMDFNPTYFIVSDHLVAEQNLEEIKNYKGSVNLFPAELKYCLKKVKKVIYFPTDSAPLYQPEFSPNAMIGVYHGETVTYLCLQLAYYMGIKEVYLIGNDWDWGQKYNNYPFGTVVTGGNKTHFTPDYHKKGEKWVTPNIAIGEKVFSKAKEYYENHGGKVYNATIGGKLEVYPRVNYKDVVKPTPSNDLQFQKVFWKDKLAKHNRKSKEIYGYEWGNPNERKAKDSAGNILGDYLKIKIEYLLPYMKKKSTIMDVGCGGGKWTQYMLSAGKIIGVDLNDEFYEEIKRKINSDKITFYKTYGSELNGIANKSIDFIFSMDTLVRVPRYCIFSYFGEFARVLKPDGKMCIHLPCNIKKFCADKHMVDISLEEIDKYCINNGLKNYEIDKDTINHGVILKVGYHGK